MWQVQIRSVQDVFGVYGIRVDHIVSILILVQSNFLTCNISFLNCVSETEINNVHFSFVISSFIIVVMQIGKEVSHS